MATAITTFRSFAATGDEGTSDAYALVDASGNTFANNGRKVVHIVNGSGANAYTVTITTQATYKGYAVADQTVSVGTSEDWFIGPFNEALFNNSAGSVSITYTGSAPATDLTIAVYGY